MDSKDFVTVYVDVDSFKESNSIDEDDDGSSGFKNCIDYDDSLRKWYLKIDKNSNETDFDEPPAKILKMGMSANVDDFGGLKEDTASYYPELGLNFNYVPSMENVQIKENVKWLNSSADNDLQNLSQDELDCWLKWDERQATDDDGESQFCDTRILQQILKSKTTIDQIDRHEMEKARSKCNPFDAVSCSLFQNAAAVKMANIDATLNFMFTDPKDENGQSLVTDLLYFADVCSGPGGFSEYVLWRNKWKTKGFAFTLKSKDDIDSAGKTVDTFYGVKDDGNILDPENIESLQKYVLNQTNETGVHFLMAGGCFSPEKTFKKEMLCKQLYLCQCLTALYLVQEGGHFIVKLFDVLTLFSAGLVYLMFKCFNEITIMKPNASRPDSSERYLIGKFKKVNTDTVRQYLFKVNQKIWETGKDSVVDCVQIVPYEIIAEDRHFLDYLCESNNEIGQHQVDSLLKIIAFCNHKNLSDATQKEIRQKCLEAWMLPNTMRKIQSKSVDETFKQLMNKWFDLKDFMSSPDRKLCDEFDMSRIFRNRSDWFFVPIGTVQEIGIFNRTFFLSYGGYEVFYYTSNGTWKPLKSIALEICANTLIYGDIVAELNSDQTYTTALHIIDGMVLGGFDIRHLPLQGRLKMCEKFANSLNKPSKLVNYGDEQISSSPISCKKLHPLNDFRQFFNQLSFCTLPDGRERLGFKIENCFGIDRWYVPRGLLFFNKMKPNIEMAYSKTYQKQYFVDRSTGSTFFQDQIKDPTSIFASFKTTFVNRYVWKWKYQNQVDENVDGKNKIDGNLYRCDLDDFIYD